MSSPKTTNEQELQYRIRCLTEDLDRATQTLIDIRSGRDGVTTLEKARQAAERTLEDLEHRAY